MSVPLIGRDKERCLLHGLVERVTDGGGAALSAAIGDAEATMSWLPVTTRLERAFAARGAPAAGGHPGPAAGGGAQRRRRPAGGAERRDGAGRRTGHSGRPAAAATSTWSRCPATGCGSAIR